MSLKTLDVAIGAVFLFVLLTFVASALLEIISRSLNWRAKNLYEAIATMLVGSELIQAAEVYSNPMVVALGRDTAAIPRRAFLERLGWRAQKNRVPPSYIPPATFSAIVIEELLRRSAECAAGEQSLELSPEGSIKVLREVVSRNLNHNDALLSVLITTLATQGSSIQAVRLAIERWFSDTMDRASGWYKRRTQSFLLAFGILVAFGGNVNTIAVVQWLWKSDAARQAVLTAATDYERQTAMASRTAAGANAAMPNLDAVTKRIADADQKINDLQYPIGWNIDGRRLERRVGFSLPQYFLGCLITAIAISMGSTFWFDALQCLIRIRSTGPKPVTR